MKLTDSQAAWLRWLAERGGSGYLDRYGRVNAQGENAPRAAWPAWMNLVAAGLLAGGDQRLTITDYGKRHLPPNARIQRREPA
jgi:hypothetical protein